MQMALDDDRHRLHDIVIYNPAHSLFFAGLSTMLKLLKLQTLAYRVALGHPPRVKLRDIRPSLLCSPMSRIYNVSYNHRGYNGQNHAANYTISPH
jgi:hypothetical protein